MHRGVNFIANVNNQQNEKSIKSSFYSSLFNSTDGCRSGRRSIRLDDEKLKGYDACFFCAGVSAVGKTEEEYRKITYDTTLHFAKALKPNPGMSFIYVSGGGTDTTEKCRMMWARVKGKTENDLAKLPFKQTFGFRIGFVKPAVGQQHVLSYYRYVAWLFPVIKNVFPSMYSTMKQVADGMVHVARNGYQRGVVYVEDIRKMPSN